MSKLKTVGKWLLYLIGAVLAYLLFASASEFQRLVAVLLVVGWFALDANTKQRNSDLEHHYQTKLNLQNLISSQERAIERLHDRIYALENSRSVDFSDDG